MGKPVPNHFVLTVWLALSFGSSAFCYQYSCKCGYGGLCLYNQSSPCNCPAVSKGFYKYNDCNGIVDHCSRASCGTGKCVRSFGGYFCDCPKGFYGPACEHNLPELSDIGVKNDLYILYQVQPIPQERLYFHIIYDMVDAHAKTNGLVDLELIVSISDGRRFYPKASNFKREKLNEMCYRQAAQYPFAHDVNVCKLVPKGDVQAYTFNPELSSPLALPKGKVFVPDNDEPVGRSGDVILHLSAIYNRSGSLSNYTLYSRTYTVFTYYQGRVTYDCFVDFSFEGCGIKPGYPSFYLREARISIRPVIYLINCTGASYYSSLWKIQRNVDLKEYRDADPQVDLDHNGKSSFFIAPVTLHDSVHLIEYIHLLRGHPPIYGGTEVFEKVGRCYIRTIHGNPLVHIAGGETREASRYATLRLEMVFENKGFKLTEMHFLVECVAIFREDNLEDPDCYERTLTVPVYRKTPPAVLLRANESILYLFTLRAISLIDYIPGEIAVKFVAITFKRTEESVTIHCLYNCYPVDPARRIIMIANSKPYSPYPVLWDVHVGPNILPDPKQLNVFYPLSASRIYRNEGSNFILEDQTNDIIVRVFDRDSSAVKYLKSDNVAPVLQKFDLKTVARPGGDMYQFAPSTKNIPYYYHPVRYEVYEVDEATRGVLTILDINFKSHIFFTPRWKAVVLCIVNGVQTAACSQPMNVTKSDESPLTLENIRALGQSTSSGALLIATVRFLRQGLGSGTVFRWNLTLAERAEVVTLVRTLSFVHPREFTVMCQIVSMLFYSDQGNEQEGLQAFENETPVLGSFDTIVEWLRLRTKAMELFAFTVGGIKRWALMMATKDSNLKRYVYWDILELSFETWTLGHFQATFLVEFEKHIDSINEEVLRAELRHHRRRLGKLSSNNMQDFIISAAKLHPLYYGIRTLGRDNSSRMWFATSSYNGFVQSLNKSIPPQQTNKMFVDCFFCPVDGTWWRYADLKLPPPSEELATDQLTLLLALAKNRRLDETISPFLFFSIVNSSGVSLKALPNNAYYHVTLPRMWKGELYNETVQSLLNVFTVLQPNTTEQSVRLRHFLVQKLTLPTRFASWQEEFYLNKSSTHSLKVLITFARLPDMEEVAAEPDITFQPSSSFPNQLVYSSVNVNGRESGGDVPIHFYVGILPGSTVMPGEMLSFLQPKHIEVCKQTDMVVGEFEENCLGDPDKDLHDIKCSCNKLGVGIRAMGYPVHRVRILMDLIPLSVPHAVRQIEVFIIPAVIAVFILSLLVVAFLRDARRNKIGLIYLKDTYVEDKNVVIVGVFTSMRYLAGTRSAVAIQIHGSKSSSRVHMLRADQRKKTLFMGEDSWFVLTTRHVLGKIAYIKLWHDFDRLSDWHCSHIYIHEPVTGKWFVARVHRWFRVQTPLEDATRLAVIDAIEVDAVDGVFLKVQTSFGEHFFNEIRNTHHLLSLVFLKDRSLSSMEQRCIMFIVKMLGMIFMVWVVEEKFYNWVTGKELDPVSSRNLNTLSDLPIFLAFLTVLFSIPVTLPLTLAYRMNWKSLLLQKKITNPINLQLAKPEDLVVKKKPDQLVRHGHKPPRQRSPGSILDHKNETSDSDIQGEKKKVAFVEPSAPIRRMSRALSDLIYRKIEWSKSNVRQQWKRHVLHIMGPSQYRCANVNSEIFLLKARKRLMRIRVGAALIILSLFVTIVLLLQLTQIWTKLPALGYILIFAFFIDVVIVDPLLIAANSLFMYYILEVTNKESYLWNEDIKVHGPTPLQYKDYIETATSPIYKPLLMPALKKKRIQEDAWSLFKAVGFYIASALAIGLAFSILEHSYDNRHYYHIRSIKSQLEDPNNKLLRPSYYIREVTTPTIAMDYLATSVADLSLVWYNNKYISADRQRWSSSRVSKPLGAANMIIEFIPNEGGKARLTKVMARYFDSVSGFLSDGDAEKGEIALGGFKLTYMNISYGSVSGKTRETYPLRGHNLTMPMDDFGFYYGSLLNVLSDLVVGTSRSHYPRVLILTFNLISAFARRVSTIDAIVEYLPSGLATAELHVLSFLAYDVDRERYDLYRYTMVFLLIFHFLYTASECVKHPAGIMAYFMTSNGMIKVLIYPTSLVMVVAALFHDEYQALETIIHLPHAVYTDLHYVHFKGTIVATLELIIICAVVLDSFFALWNAFGADQLKETMSAKCVHYCFVMFLIHMYIALDANVCSNVFDRKIAALELLFYIKEATNVVNDYNRGFLMVAISALLVFSKASTAIFLGNYFEREPIHFERTALMRAVKKMYRHPLPRKFTVFMKRKSEMPARESESSSSSDSLKHRKERDSHVERVKITNKKFKLYFGKIA